MAITDVNEILEKTKLKQKAYVKFAEVTLNSLCKRIGDEPEDHEEKEVYYKKIIDLLDIAKTNIVNGITNGKKNSAESKQLALEEQWLFIERYQMYVISMVEKK